MFLVAVIWGLLVGNATQLQLTYDKCKPDNFEGKHCVVAKKLDELGKK
jgi:hypothetical protein